MKKIIDDKIAQMEKELKELKVIQASYDSTLDSGIFSVGQKWFWRDEDEINDYYQVITDVEVFAKKIKLQYKAVHIEGNRINYEERDSISVFFEDGELNLADLGSHVSEFTPMVESLFMYFETQESDSRI